MSSQLFLNYCATIFFAFNPTSLSDDLTCESISFSVHTQKLEISYHHQTRTEANSEEILREKKLYESFEDFHTHSCSHVFLIVHDFLVHDDFHLLSFEQTFVCRLDSIWSGGAGSLARISSVPDFSNLSSAFLSESCAS